jgi:hypothetical protein
MYVMACPLSLVKILHVALLHFIYLFYFSFFLQKHLVLSLMCFGSCPCVKYGDLRVAVDTPDRREFMMIFFNELYVNTSRVFRLVQ